MPDDRTTDALKHCKRKALEFEEADADGDQEVRVHQRLAKSSNRQRADSKIQRSPTASPNPMRACLGIARADQL